MKRLMLSVAVGTALLALGTARSHAQDARAALRAGHAAYEIADFAAAVEPLSRGLDPAAGYGDSLWVLGLHRLVESLLDQGQHAVAQVWLRWAFRLSPQLPIDSVNFFPAVVDAFRSGRSDAQQTRPVNARVRTSWRWRGPYAPAASGTLTLASGDYRITALVANRTGLTSGDSVTLTPGSYRLDFSAEGFLAGNLTAEVLPGVTTVLQLDLEPAFPALLYVNARPWGAVYLNGDSIGVTMLAAHRLPPGSYLVRILRDGYFPYDTAFTAVQGDTIRIGTVQLTARVRGPGR